MLDSTLLEIEIYVINSDSETSTIPEDKQHGDSKYSTGPAGTNLHESAHHSEDDRLEVLTQVATGPAETNLNESAHDSEDERHEV